jgi:hypothetical protein
MSESPEFVVHVQTVELDGTGGRQIAPRHKTTALLSERREEIEEGIRAAVDVVTASLSKPRPDDGWRVASVEATFGITLAAEAGVVLTRASAEASFEVTLTVERVG